MLFNPDPTKQAIEASFSHKHSKIIYPLSVFNNDIVQSSPKLNFNDHINKTINKCDKTIVEMKKLSLFLSKKTLLSIYKSFNKPNLDYADIIYDKPFNDSFKNIMHVLILLQKLKGLHGIVFTRNLV